MLLSVEQEVELKAEHARQLLGLGSQLRLSGIQLLEAARDKGVISNYAVVPDSQLLGKQGHYDGVTGVVCVPQSVFHGSNSGDGRSLFSVAHEISHALSGHKTSRNRSNTKSAAEKAAPSIVKEEREAERLAAALIAPYSLSDYTPATTAADIAERFGISLSAAEVRRKEYASLYRREHGLPRDLPGNVVDLRSLFESRGKAREDRNAAASTVTARLAQSSHALAVKPIYDTRSCPNCGNTTLCATGSRFICDTIGCKFYGDLPDGD